MMLKWVKFLWAKACIFIEITSIFNSSWRKEKAVTEYSSPQHRCLPWELVKRNSLCTFWVLCISVVIPLQVIREGLIRSIHGSHSPPLIIFAALLCICFPHVLFQGVTRTLRIVFNMQAKPRFIDSIKMLSILFSSFPLIIFMSPFAFSMWLSTQMIFAVNYAQWP